MSLKKITWPLGLNQCGASVARALFLAVLAAFALPAPAYATKKGNLRGRELVVRSDPKLGLQEFVLHRDGRGATIYTTPPGGKPLRNISRFRRPVGEELEPSERKAALVEAVA